MPINELLKREDHQWVVEHDPDLLNNAADETQFELAVIEERMGLTNLLTSQVLQNVPPTPFRQQMIRCSVERILEMVVFMLYQTRRKVRDQILDDYPVMKLVTNDFSFDVTKKGKTKSNHMAD